MTAAPDALRVRGGKRGKHKNWERKMNAHKNWEGKMKNVLLATVASIIAVGVSGVAHAEFSPTDNVTVGGRLKQGIALAYDEDMVGSGAEIGQMNYLAELKSTWRATSDLTFIGDFWLRGDWYGQAGGDLNGWGNQDYSSPNFRRRFGYHLNNGSARFPSGPFNANPPASPYSSGDDQDRFFSDFNTEVIREVSAKLTDPQNRYAVKVGKFVRAWGQSDGVRLLDVLQAQDLRQKFILGDADETRIPSWMAAFDLNLEQLGLAAPLEFLGLDDPKLELIYMPEYHHNRFTINNPTPGDETSGGLYGVPFPALIDNVSGFGIPFIGANLHDKEPNRFDFQEPTLGGRLKFGALGGEGTLNALYGYQEMPIVKMTGSHLVIGNAFGDESTAAAVVPLDVATTESIVHLAYLPLVRSGANAAAIQNALGGLTGGACGATSPSVACSVNVQFDLDYTYRRKLIGGSFTRDMTELQLGPKGVSPVLRAEFSYEFDKPFNRSKVVTVTNPVYLGGPNTTIIDSSKGSGALIVDPTRGVAREDQVSVMVGADYFLWLPFWKTQDQSIFTSFQVFTVMTPNGDDLLFQAPYAGYGSEVHKVQNYVTLLLDTALDHGRLGVNFLGVYDPQNDGWAVRQRIDFNYFGDSWRPRIELSHYEADPERGILGIASHADNVEFSLTYQF